MIIILHIDTSITHDDTHFTLTPIELIKDCGEPLLNTFERLKRESYWMVLIGTIKPYGLNTKSVDFAPKYQPPFKKILPFVVPFSKTANLAANIIKKHYKMIMNLRFLTLMLSQPTPGIKIYLII